VKCQWVAAQISGQSWYSGGTIDNSSGLFTVTKTIAWKSKWNKLLWKINKSEVELPDLSTCRELFSRSITEPVSNFSRLNIPLLKHLSYFLDAKCRVFQYKCQEFSKYPNTKISIYKIYNFFENLLLGSVEQILLFQLPRSANFHHWFFSIVGQYLKGKMLHLAFKWENKSHNVCFLCKKTKACLCFATQLSDPYTSSD